LENKLRLLTGKELTKFGNESEHRLRDKDRSQVPLSCDCWDSHCYTPFTLLT